MFRYLLYILIAITCISCTQQLRMDAHGVGELTPTGPTALAWDGKSLIAGKDGLILFFENIDTAATGSIYNYEGHYFFGKFPVRITSKDFSPQITGLAWEKTAGGKGYIWVADAANRRILNISPEGKTFREIKIKDIYPEDMTFDGQYLWIVDSKRKRIFKLTTVDGSVVEEFLSPVNIPKTVAWDGKYLIIGGIINPDFPYTTSENIKIVKLDTHSGKIVEELFIPKHFTQHLSVLSLPTAMTWINGKIWVSDRNSGNIVILNDWTQKSEDPNNYKLTSVSPTFKKVPAKERIHDIEEAKRAAEEARKAAEEAKRAAEAAKKAFELQQKK